MTAIEDDSPDAGPVYDVDTPTLRKFRRQGKKADRKAYGAAVEAAVLSKQRALLVRKITSRDAMCASGTFHSDGAKIIAAVISQQRAALAAAPAQIRRARKPETWLQMYNAAMRERWGQKWKDVEL